MVVILINVGVIDPQLLGSFPRLRKCAGEHCISLSPALQQQLEATDAGLDFLLPALIFEVSQTILTQLISLIFSERVKFLNYSFVKSVENFFYASEVELIVSQLQQVFDDQYRVKLCFGTYITLD